MHTSLYKNGNPNSVQENRTQKYLASNISDVSDIRIRIKIDIHNIEKRKNVDADAWKKYINQEKNTNKQNSIPGSKEKDAILHHK